MSPAMKKKASAKDGSKKKAAPKRKVAAKKRVSHKKASPIPSGYTIPIGAQIIRPSPRRLSGEGEPVAPNKIRSGIEKAKIELTNLLQELSDITAGFNISEIELEVSFSADGKFLGIGVGGATTISMRFTHS